MKILTAYFSLSGETKKAAERIHRLAGGDLFEIKAEKDYGGYFKAIAVCAKEIASREKPKVTSHVRNFNSYDRIFIGFPIWYGSCPPLIRTFVDEYDFSGKDVSVFCTSTASGSGKSEKVMKEICKGANVRSSIRISKQSDEEIKLWLEK